MISCSVWRRKAARIFNKIVLSLGSLHLTLMAAIGIWFWSSPVRFGDAQHEPIVHTILECTTTSLLGKTINLNSSPLRVVSLVIYAFFAVPGLNLVMPAAFFFALHFVYHRRRPQDDDTEPSVVPVYISLLFLLAVNIVFMVDIETTISFHHVAEDSQWTFGQTLAVLLLVLPLRDVIMFIVGVLKEERNRKRRMECTKELKAALEDKGDDGERMKRVRKAVKYADIREEASGMLSVRHAAYRG
jgi:hypothetical protein